jgi:Holliday junction resolvase RusA-like endonuclease
MPRVQIAEIEVVPAPRQSQRDAWKPRPCVLRYRASADHLRLLRLRLPARFVLVFYLAMPASWSRTKRDAHRGQPMQQMPDGDNLQKTVMDALVHQDGRLWDGRWIKVWADRPRLVIVDAGAVTVTEAHWVKWCPAVPGPGEPRPDR